MNSLLAAANGASRTRLLQRVARSLGIGVDRLLDKRRDRDTADKRHVAAWLLRRGHSMSYPALGRMLERDHTSVMHAVRRVEAERAMSPELAERLEELLDEIAKEDQ